MILCLPHRLHTSCSSMHPMHLKPFWGHTATTLETSYAYFGQALRSDVTALHSETQTPHLRPAEDRAASASVWHSFPPSFDQSMLFKAYFTVTVSNTPHAAGKVEKGMKTAGKRGWCVLWKLGKKTLLRVLRNTFLQTHDTASTSTTGLAQSSLRQDRPEPRAAEEAQLFRGTCLREELSYSSSLQGTQTSSVLSARFNTLFTFFRLRKSETKRQALVCFKEIL